HEHIHDLVESGMVDEKRRKEVVKNQVKQLLSTTPSQFNCYESTPSSSMVKCAKQFASLFANVSIIISQDDKTKSFGTSSLTHIEDLQYLTQDSQYDEALKTNDEIRPIWMLLVDEDRIKI
ncbi:5173_t:CDS:2, partial [Gigaspora margarita]